MKKIRMIAAIAGALVLSVLSFITIAESVKKIDKKNSSTELPTGPVCPDATEKPVMVKGPGQIVEIKLTANPSTGFSWFLSAYDHNLVEPLSQTYVAPKNAQPGEAGCSVWKFKAKPAAFTVPHVSYIFLQYMRPWTEEGVKRKLITIVTSSQR